MIRRTCLAALVALAASSAFASTTYDHLYAFGDSYSDNGAGERITKAMAQQKIKDAQELPGALYWQGRWSNGPTAVEGLAKALATPLTDYGVGGAKSGNGNYYGWVSPSRDTGLFGQVDEHLKAAKGHAADPNALYFIFISANDFFEWADFERSEPIEVLAQSSIANIQQAAQTLIQAGAKHLMVVGTTDLSRVPAVAMGDKAKSAFAYQQALAQQLPRTLASLSDAKQVDITYFDHLAFSDGVRSNPEAVGLKNLDVPCQPTFPEVKSACQDPDAYYYWDEWHPTGRVHALAAEAMLKALKAKAN